MAKKIVSPAKGMIVQDWKAWGMNLFRFTAPLLAVFFGQLQMGVSLKAASLTLLYALYGAVADWLKKWSGTTTYIS